MQYTLFLPVNATLFQFLSKKVSLTAIYRLFEGYGGLDDVEQAQASKAQGRALEEEYLGGLPCEDPCHDVYDAVEHLVYVMVL